jgi:restriction system protein
MIPDFQTLMLPMLIIAGDGKEHSMSDITDSLSKKFKLTEDELNVLLPSGKQKTFTNRVHWTKAHLKMSKLLEDTKRSHFRITERGLDVLKEKPQNINIKFLRQSSEYLDSRNKNETSISNDEVKENVSAIETPEELLESGYQKIRQVLETEILSKLKSVHPSFFEKIVVELLVKMGYGGSIAEAGKATRYSKDEGIDGIIKEDKLGLDVIYIQAKRWEGVIGRSEIQKFVGALAGQGAKKGIFITTSYFSKEALDYIPRNETKIVLIDGEKLSQYMIDYNLGVSVQNTYEIKKN